MLDLLKKRYALIQKSLEFCLGRQKPRGTVLMFHHIYADEEPPCEPNFSMSVYHFEQMLDHLSETHRIVSIHHFSDVEALQPGDVVLTFDDVFRSAYQNAVPLLRKRQIPYVTFVATGLVGRSGYITAKDLEDLQADPLCTVGAHSVHHELFRFHPDTVASEIRESAETLGTDLFAYPYGSVFACSRKNQMQAAASSCISCAFSTLDAPISDYALQNRFFLPRMNMNDARFQTSIIMKQRFL